MEVDVRVAGILVGADLLEIAIGIGPAGDRLGEILRCQVLGRLLEVSGSRELVPEVAAERGVGPDLARCP
jgi:hypothetical protein